MLSLWDVLLGLGLPALCGAILFVALRRAAGEAAVLGVGVGFLIGYVAINQSSWIPLNEPAHYVFLGAAAMLLVAAIHQYAWPHAWFWHIGSLLILAGAIGGSFSLLADPEWTVAQKIVWGIVLWVASGLMTIGLGFRFGRRAVGESGIDDLIVAVALTIVSGLCAVVVGMSGTQTYGRLAAVVPAILAPIVLLSLLLRIRVVWPDIAALYVITVDGMLLCTHLFASLTVLNAVLLSLAPVGLYLDYLPVVRKRAAWQRGAIQLVACLIPAGIAFGLALSKFLRDMSAEFGSW
jgi:hypothetical protein